MMASRCRILFGQRDAGHDEKALEKDPWDRYQSMREIVADLKRVQRPEGGETTIRWPTPESGG